MRPKPMVEIGGRPIMWHIMQHYAHFGFKDFVVALGYKGEFIKRWFTDYSRLTQDLTIALGSGTVKPREGGPPVDDWSIELVDTGQKTDTGGRIKRLEPIIGRERFLLTWGDGVSDIDLEDLVSFHESHGKLVTVTAVRPPARFGALELDGERVDHFREKPQLEGLARDGELMAYKHDGFWQCMDTIRDRNRLEDLWASGEAPWKVWA